MTPATTPYRLMAMNNAWANRTIHTAIDDMDHHAFTARRPGFFPSLSRTLNHIYEVDLYYLDALEEGGLGQGVFEREDIEQPGRLGAAQAELDLRLAQFCARLETETLDERRATVRSGGIVEETVSALLLHLFQHQIHHRGQAHVQIQDAGITPPQLDEFFLEHGRARSAAAYFG